MAFLKKPLKWTALGQEPSELKKNEGFKMDESPAPGHFDFMFRSTYEAIEELQQKAGEVKTVNNVQPDVNGNILITLPDTSKLYQKPTSGIPKTDLDATVQASLKKADDAAPLTELTKTNQALTTHQADLAHVHWIGTATGTNALTATYAPITELKEGLAVSFKNTNASTAATTLKINELAAIPIINAEGEAQTDLKNGVYTVRYSNGNFILQGSGIGVSKTTQISNLTAVSNFVATFKIEVAWKNPTDVTFKGVRIVYKANSYPTSPYDGTLAYQNTIDSVAEKVTITSGITKGVTYYFRAFAFTYKNDKLVFTSSTNGAQVSVLATQQQGLVEIISSRNWTVPPDVTSIDLFLVGGGGGGGIFGTLTNATGAGGGGGGGRTRSYTGIAVTPGQSLPVVVGAGGAVAVSKYGTGGMGGATSITINGTTYTVNGGDGGRSGSNTTNFSCGGNGGSGGGAGSAFFKDSSTSYVAGNAGYDGSSSTGGHLQASGQLTTTRAFGNGSYYAGGGGGEGGVIGSPNGTGGTGGGGNGNSNGTANTGGGGGGNANGGSGVVIIRWGY